MIERSNQSCKAKRSLILVTALAIALGARGSSSFAQPPPTQLERQVENVIPKHVPIEVKITKEKEKNWKDLKNENWARDFELEITNTGQKPIFALKLLLFFDVPNEHQDFLVAHITYLSSGIKNALSIATSDDIPIKPGESKILSLRPTDVLTLEKGRREKGYRLPTKVKIKFGLLSFGDGTGLLGVEAAPYPVRPKTSPQSSFTTPARGKSHPVIRRSAAMRMQES